MATPRLQISQAQVVGLRDQGKSWREIAEIIGCHINTIKRRSREWGLIGRATEAVEEAAANATRVSVAKWTLRRAEEADRSGHVAAQVLTRLSQILPNVGLPLRNKAGEIIAPPSMTGLDVQRLARTYEILVRNAQLLSGGATDRIVTTGESVDDEIRRLMADMEDAEQLREDSVAGGDD